jgi:NOL1/NOP2/sun family putative RNA methylase
MEPLFEQYQDIIPEFDRFQESLGRPLPVHFRANRLKIDPGRLPALLMEKGIHVEAVTDRDDTLFVASPLKSPGNLLEYFLGYFHPQALTSCLVSLILSPAPRSYVLDLCASPGGKTSHMAQLMENTGLIIANELHASRHIPLGHTLTRLGVLNTLLTAYQAQEFPLRDRFDYVLADVPCSGEGRFRMTGEGGGHRKGRGVARLSETQKRIILRGFDLLKPGGVMVYSTCTYNPEENEAVVEFLIRNREAELLPIETVARIEPGLSVWKNETYDRQLRRAVRIYPHRVDSVGFFVARIGKRG